MEGEIVGKNALKNPALGVYFNVSKNISEKFGKKLHLEIYKNLDQKTPKKIEITEITSADNTELKIIGLKPVDNNQPKCAEQAPINIKSSSHTAYTLTESDFSDSTTPKSSIIGNLKKLASTTVGNARDVLSNLKKTLKKPNPTSNIKDILEPQEPPTASASASAKAKLIQRIKAIPENYRLSKITLADSASRETKVNSILQKMLHAFIILAAVAAGIFVIALIYTQVISKSGNWLGGYYCWDKRHETIPRITDTHGNTECPYNYQKALESRESFCQRVTTHSLTKALNEEKYQECLHSNDGKAGSKST